MAEKNGGEFWAFIAGTLLGGIVALLYAPVPGVETREKIRDSAIDVRDRSEDLAIKTREEAEKVLEIAKKKLDEFKKLGEEDSKEAEEKKSKK